MFVQLPTELDRSPGAAAGDSQGDERGKRGAQGARCQHVADWAEHATPNVFAAAARLYTRMKLADRHRPVANLGDLQRPGPDFPLYMAGSELLAMFPLGPSWTAWDSTSRS